MSTTAATTLDTSPVTRAEAARIESAEAHAWSDLYAAAPARWAAAAGLGARWVGRSLVLHWAASKRRYFSRAIGLGVTGLASEHQLDQILALWRELGIEMYLVQSLPHCHPHGYEQWLRDRGLEPFDAQDRVMRGGGPLAIKAGRAAEREFRVDEVSADGTDEWSEFVQDVYRLDAGPWLPRLVGRRGWHQYVARESGQIVAARAMYIGPDRIAWLGMDAPVPGITTTDFRPDAALCARMVADGLARGVRTFVADIEAQSPQMSTPAYASFSALGFRRPFIRTHHTRRQ